MSDRLPTVLVTGASRGIGKAVAEMLAAHGWRVVAGVRDTGSAVFDHPNITVERIDLVDHASIREGVERAESIAGGALDALVNNAGHAVAGPFEHLEMDIIREVFEVNTIGTVAITQAVLPAMREAGRGHIIFVSTVGVHLDTPGLSAYRASKAALNAFADTMAFETHRFGIRVARAEPGMVDTELAQSTRRAARLGDPESPYSEVNRGFLDGFRRWREWVNIPANDVAATVMELLNDPNPPSAVLVGPDAEHLVTLDRAGLAEFFGIDSS